MRSAVKQNPWDKPLKVASLKDLGKAVESREKIVDEKSETVKAFGRSLVARLEALSLSQKELGEVLGMAQSEVSKIATGALKGLTLQRAAYIASVMGMDLTKIAAVAPCDEAKTRLRELLSGHQEKIDKEIREAEERIAALKQRKAFGARLAMEDRS